MEHIFIAAKNTDVCRTLSDTVDPALYTVTTATDGSTVRNIDLGRFYAFFISFPLSNESGEELIKWLRGHTHAHITAIISRDSKPAARERISAMGAYIILRPVYKGTIMQAMDFLEFHAKYETALREKNAALEKQLTEQKLIFRAKLMIMQKRACTEDEAHALLQKLSMELKIPLAETADDIINGLLI